MVSSFCRRLNREELCTADSCSRFDRAPFRRIVAGVMVPVESLEQPVDFKTKRVF